MPQTRAQTNRQIRKEALRDYVKERGSVQYLFDLIDKIEGLDSNSQVFSQDLQKYKAALDARIKMIGKYMPDLKAQELDLTSSDGAMHFPSIIELIAKRSDESGD
jgi:hypothetical protein